MIRFRAAVLYFVVGFAVNAPAQDAPTAAPATTPASIRFDSETYFAVSHEQDASRVAEHFVRAGESPDRYSRRFTVADQTKATSVKQIGLGIIAITKLRTPGLETATFAAEGAEDRDLTVTWFTLTDDGIAVEFNAARFVALRDAKGATTGVREYHFVAREYTNGRHPDQVFASLAPVVGGFADRWVDELQTFERAPARAPGTK